MDTNLTKNDLDALKLHVRAIINILDRLDDVGYEMVNDYNMDAESGRYSDMIDWLQYLNSVKA